MISLLGKDGQMHEGDQILAIDGQVGVINTPPLRRGKLRGAMIARTPLDQ